MRLRYLRVRKMPPLHDTEVVFGQEAMLGLTGAIHFVVGINGTGKSRMLQIVAETLLTLERGRIPPFPVTIVFDLNFPNSSEARTICFYRPDRSRVRNSDAHLVEFAGIVPDNVNWSSLEAEKGHFTPIHLGVEVNQRWSGDNLPGMDLYLPQVLLAYTSGAVGAWESLFNSPQIDTQEILSGLLAEASTDYERPSGWRPPLSHSIPISMNATIATWIRGEDYRFALLATVVKQAADEFDNELGSEKAERAFVLRRERARYDHRPLPERYDTSIRSLLDEVNWLWPITISLRTTAVPNDPDWQLMAEAATSILREPEAVGQPRGRVLYYDLRQRIDGVNTAHRLIRALNGIPLNDPTEDPETEAKALPALRRLLHWQRQGVLRSTDTRIILKKLGASSPLTLEALSDGERMFIGRMCLLYLLWDSDNALALLDEPETHFNDYWKREIVDILDKSLGKRSSDVVLTTHSSIALTDAFDQEITLLRRDPESPDHIISAHPLPPTFGASPTEVLRDIFHGPRTVGQRAAEFLDTVLLLLSYPNEVATYWETEDNSLPTRLVEAAYDKFLRDDELSWTVSERREAQQQLNRRLRETLDTLYAYGRQLPTDDSQMLVRIVRELLKKVGAGYYRFEFGRRLDAINNSQRG